MRFERIVTRKMEKRNTFMCAQCDWEINGWYYQFGDECYCEECVNADCKRIEKVVKIATLTDVLDDALFEYLRRY